MDAIDYRTSQKMYPGCNCFDEYSPNQPYRKNPEGAPCKLWENIGFVPETGREICPDFYLQICIYNDALYDNS